MTETQSRESSFIRHLADLAARDDRAALAALRRGLGRPPGTAPELFPHVARFFPDDPTRANWHLENAMFSVAALFGMLPNHRKGAGSPLKVLRQLELERESTERRVLSLLNADAETLPTHLRHLIALIRSHAPERHLDYGILLHHINQWDHTERWVQRRWARDWWAWSVPLKTDDPDSAAEEETTD